jgi:hypothetical protein
MEVGYESDGRVHQCRAFRRFVEKQVVVAGTDDSHGPRGWDLQHV